MYVRMYVYVYNKVIVCMNIRKYVSMFLCLLNIFISKYKTSWTQKHTSVQVQAIFMQTISRLIYFAARNINNSELGVAIKVSGSKTLLQTN